MALATDLPIYRTAARPRGDVPPFCTEGARAKVEPITYEGAMIAAVAIRDAWWSLGHYARIWVEREALGRGPGTTIWVIRSDMVGGMPRRRHVRGDTPCPVVLRKEAA